MLRAFKQNSIIWALLMMPTWKSTWSKSHRKLPWKSTTIVDKKNTTNWHSQKKKRLLWISSIGAKGRNQKSCYALDAVLCSEKKVTHNLEGIRKAKLKWDQGAPRGQRVCGSRRDFDPSRYFDSNSTLVKLYETRQKDPATRPISFKPTTEASNGKWVRPTYGRKRGQGKWQNFEIDRGSLLAYRKEFQASRKAAHISENYNGKNPMTRSQWKREQKRRKMQREIGARENVESNTNVPFRKKEKEDLKLVERKDAYHSRKGRQRKI